MSLPVGYLQALSILKASKDTKPTDNYITYRKKNLRDNPTMSKIYLFAK